MGRLRSSEHEQFKHGSGELIGCRIGHFFGENLIELRLEDLFSSATVEVSGFADSLSHGAHQLNEESLANELVERFAGLCFLSCRIPCKFGRSRSRWLKSRTGMSNGWNLH